jgi:hypothetical protein
MTDAATLWTDDQRGLIDALLNQLIPASRDGRVPAAGDLGVGDFLAGQVAADADLQAVFAEGLARASETGVPDAQAVARLEVACPGFFGALQRLAYMGYYSRPDTRLLLGLSPRAVHPDGYEVPTESDDLMAALTAPVRARGQCYRDA